MWGKILADRLEIFLAVMFWFGKDIQLGVD
jgi:hypothetical protein